MTKAPSGAGSPPTPNGAAGTTKPSLYERLAGRGDEHAVDELLRLLAAQGQMEELRERADYGDIHAAVELADAEWTPPASWHIDALRDAGFREAGIVWRARRGSAAAAIR